jgi:hypothetical protein
MKAFTFAEINLAKRCFRVVRVIAKTESQAHQALPGGDWAWGLLGVGETRAKTVSARSQLIRTREAWTEFVRQFGLTAESAEARISGAMTVPSLDDKGRMWAQT